MDFIMPQMNGFGNSPSLNGSSSGRSHFDGHYRPFEATGSRGKTSRNQGALCENEIECVLRAAEAVLGGGTYFSEEAVA